MEVNDSGSGEKPGMTGGVSGSGNRVRPSVTICEDNCNQDTDVTRQHPIETNYNKNGSSHPPNGNVKPLPLIVEKEASSCEMKDMASPPPPPPVSQHQRKPPPPVPIRQSTLGLTSTNENSFDSDKKLENCYSRLVLL